jgi:ferredoxin
MRLKVDPDRCEGHAQCVVYAPELITLNEDGHAVVTVTDPSLSQEAEARAAQQACPERAIELELE